MSVCEQHGRNEKKKKSRGYEKEDEPNDGMCDCFYVAEKAAEDQKGRRAEEDLLDGGLREKKRE